MRQQINLTANVHISIIDAETGELLREQRHHNLVVDAGLDLLRDFLDGDAPAAITHFGYGTGTAAVTAGDTALDTQTARPAITSKTGTVSKQWQATYFLTSTTGNGNTYGEVGLFNAATGGTMFARVKLSPVIVKTSSIAVNFVWTINLGAS